MVLISVSKLKKFDPNTDLQALVAKGLVRLGNAEVIKNWRPKPVNTGHSVLDALLEERRQGR